MCVECVFFFYCKGNLLCWKTEKAQYVNLQDPLAFWPAVSSSAVRQDYALILHATHPRSLQDSCTSKWEKKILIYYIVEGLRCSHFVGKAAENLECFLDSVSAMFLRRALVHVVFLPCSVMLEGCELKSSSFLYCFQMSNSSS